MTGIRYTIQLATVFALFMFNVAVFGRDAEMTALVELLKRLKQLSMSKVKTVVCSLDLVRDTWARNDAYML